MMTNVVDIPKILEAFKRSLYAEDASSNTTRAYLSDLFHFVSWYTQTISDFHIDEITPSDIRAYREFLQEQIPPTAPATINRHLAALRRFFTWAIDNHLTEFQPTERIRNVEVVSQGPKSLDRKEWHRLERSVEQARRILGIRDRCIIQMLYHTGLRSGELAALLLSDITLGERSGYVMIRRGKGNKARRIPLNTDARAAIRDFLQVRPSCKSQSFLNGQRGEPLSSHAIYNVEVKYGRLERGRVITVTVQA